MPSFDELQAYLIRMHETRSLRDIAKEIYGNKITHGAIDRCIKGIEPHNDKIRKCLELPLIEIQYRDPITGRYVKK